MAVAVTTNQDATRPMRCHFDSSAHVLVRSCVSVFAVSRWESGKSEPGLEDGCKLGVVLRVKVEEWMEPDAGDKL